MRLNIKQTWFSATLLKNPITKIIWAFQKDVGIPRAMNLPAKCNAQSHGQLSEFPCVYSWLLS
jgi:hypothetical protein